MCSVRTRLMSAIVFVHMGLALAVSVRAQEVPIPILNPKFNMDVLTCCAGWRLRPKWNYWLDSGATKRRAKDVVNAISGHRALHRTVRRGHWQFKRIQLHLADARRNCAGQYDVRSECGGGGACGLCIHRIRCLAAGRKCGTSLRSQSDSGGRHLCNRGRGV